MKIVILITLSVLSLIGCSASTGSRYETKEGKKTETTTKTSEVKKEITEDFDISPYETEIEIEEAPIISGKLPDDVWYGYADSSAQLERKILGTTDGYRVQVLSTDDIDEANQVRTELYEKTAQKEVYVIFEPPFYKVKVGDFKSKTDANDFKFKLNQMGYTESKVVQETINLFE